MRKIRSSLLTLSLAPTLACSDTAFDDAVQRRTLRVTEHRSSSESTESPRDADAADPDEPLQHILSGVVLPEGKVPVLEVSDAPSGKKYGLYISGYSLEEQGGAVISEMGYQELVVRPNDGSERDKFPPPTPIPVVKVDARVRDHLANGAERVPVLLWLKEPDMPMLFLELQRRVFRGDVTTTRERDELRRILLEERQAAIADVQDQVLSGVRLLESTVRCINNPCIFGTVSEDELALLEANANVELIERSEDEGHDDAPLGSANIIANQLEPWWDWGYAGHGINGNEAIVALAEEGFPNEEHIAFTDGPGTGARIRSRTGCIGAGGGVTCVFPSTIPEADETDHASHTLGIIMADPYDGSSTQWTNRRGIASEAEAHLFYGNDVAAMTSVLGYVRSANPTPHVMNMSWGSDTNNTNCSGTTAFSRALNNLYEDGILPVKSAGNLSHSSTTDCTVNAPGSALGAVTVGAIGNYPPDDSTDEMKAAAIRTTSSRGGTATEGGGRAIVDLVAAGIISNGLSTAANSGSSAYSYSGSGTSTSTPYATGAALNLQDWSVRSQNGFLDYNPGLLHAMLILMTDRWNGSSYRLQGTKDNLYGAGRLRMRLLEDIGLDNPWGWQAGWTCVEDGHETEIPIIGTPIGDINVLKAAIYFYDPQHETGGGVDSINMYIERADTGAALRTANMIGNEYQFLAMREGYGGPDGLTTAPLRLVLNGIGISADNVSSHGVGCGTNEMLVWYAYYYEDSDREAAENLGDGVCSGGQMDCFVRE
jgi:hypothetical protein